MTKPLEDIQDEILDRIHAGEDVDRAAVLAAHPDHAQSLGAFFELLEVIEGPPLEGDAGLSSLGEFRVLREIGRGGMGVVYEAEQTSLKRRVALKVLPPALRMDPRLVARFRREAEAAGRLRHPGIVPVYSVGEAAGTPFFAMEMVEGRSLDAILRELRDGRDGGLPSDPAERRRWALETIAQVADALAYAHASGILHRDVKPGNIILDADGRPRLTDFGLALDQQAPGLTMAGEVFGSPQYMSPEQAVRREAPVDERTDVYSLAVTLYELLTLKLPYEGTTSAELLTALAGGRVVPPRHVDPDLPRAVEKVLLRALERDPVSRCPSASAFAEELRAAAVAPPSGAEPERVVPVVGTDSPAHATAGGTKGKGAHIELELEAELGKKGKWILLAAVLAVAFVLFVLPRLRDGDGRPEPISSRLLTGEELQALANGTAKDGPARLGETCLFDVKLRRILSRQDLGVYQLESRMALAFDRGLEIPVVVTHRWEASVNGGPFRPADQAWMSFSPSQTASATGEWVTTVQSQTCTPLLSEVLGDATRDSSVRIRHRVTLHVARQPASWTGPEKHHLGGGTKFVWSSPEQNLLVYDEYPRDYPESVSGPGVDAEMRESLAPDGMEYVGTQTDDEGRRFLSLLLHYAKPKGPLSAACEVTLYVPASGRTIGTARLNREARNAVRLENVVIEHDMWENVLFELPEPPRPEEARILLDLESGKLVALALRFTPSRELALEMASVDRYWGGALDAEVPLLPRGTADAALPGLHGRLPTR